MADLQSDLSALMKLAHQEEREGSQLLDEVEGFSRLKERECQMLRVKFEMKREECERQKEYLERKQDDLQQAMVALTGKLGTANTVVAPLGTDN